MADNGNWQIGATAELTAQRASIWSNAISERYGDDVALVSAYDGTKFLVKASTGEYLAIVNNIDNSIGLIDIYNGDSFTLNANSSTVVTNNMIGDNGMTQVTQTIDSAGAITGVTVGGTYANGSDYFEVYGDNGTLLSRTTTEIVNGEYFSRSHGLRGNAYKVKATKK